MLWHLGRHHQDGDEYGQGYLLGGNRRVNFRWDRVWRLRLQD
jgi:hypothetical protein